jgi:enoyl-CoA hydratase/carnithine racemase
MNSPLHVEQRGSVLRLTLNDPSTRNSLSENMMAALLSALESAEGDADIAVIVLAADGKVFCSGHNLKELTLRRADTDKGAKYFEQTFATCAKLMMTIAHHRCPVIAEVDGLASAAGCQLVATCDLAYASTHASFCTPGVNIGLFCSTPMVALSRNVSPKHAMEMLMTGDIHDAAHAERIGLINRCVPQNELGGVVQAVADKIAAKSKTAIRFGKRTFYDQAAMPLGEAYATTSAVMVKNMLDGAACEGIDAFLSKRQPQWPT